MTARFFLFHGLDEFAMTERVEALKAGLGDPSLASLNINQLDGRNASISEVQALCGAMPFLTDRRLVIVDGWLTRLLARSEETEGEDEAGGPPRKGEGAREAQAALVAYLSELPETTQLVLVERRELPERNAVVRAATALGHAEVRRFDLPKGDDLLKWIRARAKAEGGEFSREGAQALAEAEHDPRALGHEIVKLLTYVAFQRPVEAADVGQLTAAPTDAHIFEFVDAIGLRRGKQALAELHRLLDKEEPLYVLGMIVRQFRLILLAKELLEARHSEAEVAARLGMHPFPAGKVCAQSRNFTMPGLEAIYQRLLGCDVDIKTGRVEPATALDVLVTELAGY